MLALGLDCNAQDLQAAGSTKGRANGSAVGHAISPIFSLFPADLLLYVGKFLMGLMYPGAFHLSALNGPFWWETRLTTDPPTSRHARNNGTCWLFFSPLHFEIRREGQIH